jgi:hypothetical protein
MNRFEGGKKTDTAQRLKASLNIISDNIEEDHYRVFGSVIAAALLGRPHREIGDIDVAVDESVLKDFFDGLKKRGFKITLRWIKFLGIKFRIFLADPEGRNYLGITLFPGNFRDKHFEMNLSEKFKIVVPDKVIRKRNYIFQGVSFVGFPPEYVYWSGLQSNNPKRKYDREVLKSRIDPVQVKSSETIEVWYNNKRKKWIYPLGTFLQNILGKMAVLFGKNYDFWEDIKWGIKEKDI